MKRVLVMGGGFAGLTALRALRRAGPGVVRELVAPHDAQAFLPLLPDVVGRGFATEWLAQPYAALASRWGFQHHRTTVTRIDPDARLVVTADGETLAYDALIVATGARTTFYGQQDVQAQACALDNLDDAQRLRTAITAAAPELTFVVAGAGYTGLEIATHLVRARRLHGGAGPVVLVQRGDRVCPTLPDAFQHYLQRTVTQQGITFLPGTQVAAVTPDRVTLTSGRIIQPARLVWTAGVKTPDVVRALPVPQTPQGRLHVDACLCVRDGIFAAGDAAAITHRGEVLRMSVQFAWSEGACAGHNAWRAVTGRALRRFTPHDPGYVVPLGNGRGCGRVLGIPLYGRAPVFLHYLLCVYRTGLLRNKLRVLGGALRVGRRSRRLPAEG